jgi:O-antigen/teichoic acid export membrane protein
VQEQIKKIFSDTIIYTAGNVFNRLLPFLLLPVYTYYFAPEQYGVFSLVYSFWFLVVVFYLYGMETAFQKFFIEAKSFDERKSIYSTTLIMVLATSVLFSIIIYFLSPFLAERITGGGTNVLLFRLLAFILIIDSLSRFPLILINALQKSVLYSVINSFGVIVNVGTNLIMIIGLKMGIEAIFYSYAISYAAIFVISAVFTFNYLSFEFSKLQARTLFRFGHVFIYYGLFIISIDLIDRFMLEYFKGKEIVGIYSACYRIGIVMNLLISGFRTAWMPFFLNMKEDEGNREIFSKVFTYFCFGGLVIFLAMSLLADDLVRLKIFGYSLLNDAYQSGLVILPYILLAYLFYGLFTNLNVASYFKDKIKYLVISSAAGFVSNIIFNLILIPVYSFIGAAISTTISYFIMFITLYFYSQKVYRIDYEWKKIITGVIFTGIVFAVNILISDYLKIGYLWKIIIEILSVIILFTVLFRSNLHNFKSLFRAKIGT